HKGKRDFDVDWKDVTRFDGDLNHHPDFRIPTEDPGKLKFNHKVHLTEGMGCGFTLDRIDKTQQGRYKAENWGLVKLECSSCHQLENRGLGTRDRPLTPTLTSGLPAPRPGAYMAPIIYEQQCQACHPLTLRPKAGQGPPVTVPHRLQPADVKKF